MESEAVTIRSLRQKVRAIVCREIYHSEEGLSALQMTDLGRRTDYILFTIDYFTRRNNRENYRQVDAFINQHSQSLSALVTAAREQLTATDYFINSRQSEVGWLSKIREAELEILKDRIDRLQSVLNPPLPGPQPSPARYEDLLAQREREDTGAAR